VLAIVAGGLMALRARGPVVATALAVRTDLEQHVVASGRVRVVTRVQLSAETAGRVVSVRGVEGRRVEAGEILLQLDAAEARAAVAQARAAVAQASGRVDQVRTVGAVVTSEASRQAQTNLSRAEVELARIEKLAAAGALSRTELDDARRAVDIARAAKTSADAERQAARPEGVDANIVTAVLREREAQLAGAVARLEQTRVVAPRSGVILTRLVEPGDAVQAGTPLFELAADGETELVIEPDERNLAWIRLGQIATVSADAFPEQRFQAEVSYIAPAVDAQRGSVEVRLRVPTPPDVLKPDMTVSVDLTVVSKPRVLVVPSDAIRGAATDAPWVPVVEDGRVVRRSVTMGIRGDGHTEITSGLDEGAEVVVSTDVNVTDGQRVRARREDR
jgi:HlyD family secretion protein